VVLLSVGAALTLTYVSRTGLYRPILSHQGLVPLITLVYALLGGLVASRQPRNAIGWLFLATALLHGVNALATGNQFFELLSPTTRLPGSSLIAWSARWVWIPAETIPFVFVLLLFPNGRLLSPRWALLVWSTLLGLAGTVVSITLHPGPISAWGIADNPYGLPGAGPLLETVLNASGALLVAGIFGAMLALALRLRRSRGFERDQIRWVVYVTILLFVAFALAWPVGAALMSPAAAEEFGIIVTSLLTLGIAVSVGVAILRHRLYNLDLVINRTLVYALLTALVAALYILVVGGLGVLLEARGSLALSLVGVGLVAIVAQPVRDRLQRAVNRLMYGERDDPYAVLSRLGQRLEAVLAAEAVLPTVVETVAQALRLPYVAIKLREGDQDRVAAEFGRPAGEPLRLPLVFQGEPVGELLLSPRAPGEGFSPADRRLLEDLARQSGAAVHAVQLTTALQRSRERLVSAREEERRRLRRDLHDGLGPQLASLTLRLETARNRLAHDPGALALLAPLPAQAEHAVADIRRLVYGLRPPSLDELGLVQALRETAAQSSQPAINGTRVTVEAPAERAAWPAALPAAVEVAAYRIAQEALNNALRHAQARQCVLRLAFDAAGGWLELEVQDDGRGLPARPRFGVGLSSMRERAEELGGTCVVEARPQGGTRVRARLPCRLPEAAPLLVEA
jgi:signal transduction histidine kinase